MIPLDTPAGTAIYIVDEIEGLLYVKTDVCRGITHDLVRVEEDGRGNGEFCHIGDCFLDKQQAGRYALSIAIERVREAMLVVDSLIDYLKE